MTSLPFARAWPVSLVLAVSACSGCSSANDGQAPPPVADSMEALVRTQPRTGDLDAIRARRVLRVLVVPDKMYFFFDGAGMRGVTYDAMQEFESFINKKFNLAKAPLSVVYIPVRRDEILRALEDGRGDLAAGGLGISPERQQLVDFSDPVRDHIAVIPVGGPTAPALNSIDDLAGKEVYVPASSVFPGIVATLNARFRKERKRPVTVKPADENLDSTDILEMVNAGLVPLTLADSLQAEFWDKVFPDLEPFTGVPLLDTGAMGWAFRKNSPQLQAAVNEFINGHREGTAFGNTLLRKYLGNTKWAKNAVSGEQLDKFSSMVSLFRRFGDQYDLPYLLVAAQAFQESGLNQNARSGSGAVGVMQIKPSTAAWPPIGIRDVDQLVNNINAGTKYLRFLVDRYYAGEPMDRINKGLFAIASYNAGPARIRQLRSRAAAQGFDANRWFNNVEHVAAKEIGRETVQYVSNIYKYYLAYTMVVEHTARTRKPSIRSKNPVIY